MKLSRAARSIKNFKFSYLKMENTNEEDEFRKLVGEIKRISCLAHDEDHSNHEFCTALWLAVRRCA